MLKNLEQPMSTEACFSQKHCWPCTLVIHAVNNMLKKVEKHSYALQLLLNNEDLNKMRHEEKNSNGFVNIKKRCCGWEKFQLK